VKGNGYYLDCDRVVKLFFWSWCIVHGCICLRRD
jgi:hypothetical protein